MSAAAAIAALDYSSRDSIQAILGRRARVRMASEAVVAATEAQTPTQQVAEPLG